MVRAIRYSPARYAVLPAGIPDEGPTVSLAPRDRSGRCPNRQAQIDASGKVPSMMDLFFALHLKIVE
jgi:hypothetical protein